MACRLFGTKPLPEPMLAYCQLDHWENPVKFKSKYKRCIQENAFGNVVCEVAAILSMEYKPWIWLACLHVLFDFSFLFFCMFMMLLMIRLILNYMRLLRKWLAVKPYKSKTCPGHGGNESRACSSLGTCTPRWWSARNLWRKCWSRYNSYSKVSRTKHIEANRGAT